MAIDIYKLVNTRLADSDSQDMPDVPLEVRNFLGNLGLLKGIPLYYLIPDENYIPLNTVFLGKTEVEQGSFKFFWLDKEWIECLMDGALSIGNDEDRKLILTQAMGGNYVAEVFLEEKAERLKNQLSGAYAPEEFQDEYNKRITRYLYNGKPEPSRAQNNWCYTGFLMRSTIISAWPGVQVLAEGKDPETKKGEVNKSRPLQLLRMERIADDTLFCICEGIIEQIRIKQPPEGVHFGINDNPLLKGQAIPVSQSDQFSSGGVVDIQKLVASLNVNNSAKLAEKMVARPFEFIVNINPDKD